MKKEMELVFIADQLQTQIREILIERGIDSVITLPELSSLSEINFNVKSDDKNVDENDFKDILQESISRLSSKNNKMDFTQFEIDWADLDN